MSLKAARNPSARLLNKMANDPGFWVIPAVSVVAFIIVLTAILAQNPWFLLSISLIAFCLAVLIFSRRQTGKAGIGTRGAIMVSLVLIVICVLCFSLFYAAASKPPSNKDLINKILNDANPFVRRASALTLASKMDPSTVEEVAEKGRDNPDAKKGLEEMEGYFQDEFKDSDPEVRTKSLECLGKAGFDGLEDLCCDAVEEDKSAAVRLKAIELLSQDELSEDTVNVFFECARNDKSPKVRAEVIDLFGVKKMTGSIPLLVEILVNDKNSTVTGSAQAAVVGMPNEAAGPLIGARQGVTDSDAAASLDEILVSIGTVSTPQLVGLLGTAYSPWVEDILVKIGSGTTGAVINQICYGDINAKWSGTVVLLRIADPKDTLIPIAQNHDLNGIVTNYPAFIKKGVEGTQYILKEAARYCFSSLGFDRFVDMGNNLLNCGDELMGNLMQQLVTELPDLVITSTGQSSGSYNWGTGN